MPLREVSKTTASKAIEMVILRIAMPLGVFLFLRERWIKLGIIIVVAFVLLNCRRQPAASGLYRDHPVIHRHPPGPPRPPAFFPLAFARGPPPAAGSVHSCHPSQVLIKLHKIVVDPPS